MLMNKHNMFSYYSSAPIDAGSGWFLQEYDKIFVDHNWNRKGKKEYESGWKSDAQYSLYAGRWQNGQVGNTIVLADIEACLRRHEKALSNKRERLSQELAPADLKRSHEYFKRLDAEGYTYVAIDGNNSTSAVYHFCSGKMEGRLEMGGKTFSFEEKSSKGAISNVCVLEDISLGEMKQLFLSLNQYQSGLNPQEKRNCIDTQFAQDIRDEKERWRQIFEGLYKEPKPKKGSCGEGAFYDTLQADQLVAVVCLSLAPKKEFQSNLGNKELNKLYKDKREFTREDRGMLKALRENLIKLIPPNGPIKQNNAKFLSMVWATGILNIKGHAVKDGEKFLEWILEKDANFREQSSAQMFGNQKEQTDKDWQYWLKNKDKFHKKIAEKWETELEDCLETLLASGAVIKKRTEYKQKEDLRVKLVLLQEKQDRHGNDLTYIAAHQPDMYEIDHLQSVADGGETTLSNAELTTREDNRSKGKKSRKPHFEHQKQQ